MGINSVALFSLLATIAKSLSALLMLKILALKLGADGLGLISNTFSAIAVLSVVATGGINTGVSKYISTSKNLMETHAVIRVSLYANALISILIIILSLIYSEEISFALYSTYEYKKLILVISFLTIPIGMAMIGLAILNGLRRIDLIAVYQIFGLISGSGILYYLLSEYNMSGAIFGLYLIPALPLIYLIALARRQIVIKKSILKFSVEDYKLCLNLLAYSGIAVITILVHNSVQIYYRTEIEYWYGLTSVGHWQAMSRISDGYSQFFLVFLMSYLFPNIARSSSKSEIISYVNKSCLYVSICMIFIFFMIYLGRQLIVIIALSNEFLDIKGFFGMQLLSDFFRIMSYVPGFIALARGHVRLTIIMEISQGLLLISFGKIYILKFGALGAVYSYLNAYAVYFLIVYAAYVFWVKRWKM